MAALSKHQVCVKCVGKPLGGFSLCPHKRAYARNRRRTRINDGFCESCPEPKVPGYAACAHHLALKREKHQKLRREVFAHYGGAQCSCLGCDVVEIDFLTLDHINNDGYLGRTRVKSRGNNLYQWVKKNGYPPGFRVLCFNCNCGRRHGPCPHEKGRHVESV